MRHRIGLLLTVLFCALSVVSAETGVSDTIDLDKRLDKKVTVEVVHTTLADLADQLTRQTGVTIKVGTGAKDWKPRERRVTIFAKDIPARQLIREIVRLLDYELTTSGKEGEWEYRLWQDRKSRLAEDDAVRAAEKAKLEKDRKTRRAAFDAADLASAMTRGEATAKRDTSPYLAYLGGTDSGRALAALLSYVSRNRPNDRASFIDGKGITIQIEELPSEIRQAITTYLGSPAGRPGETIEVASVRLEPPYGEVGEHWAGTICFQPRVWASDRDYESEHSVSDQPQPVAAVLVDPDTPYGRRTGEEALAREYGAKIDDIGEDPGDSAERASIFFSIESPTEKNPPTDPELTREIEIKPPADQKERSFGPWCLGQKAGPTLKEIARATGWSVFFESFDPLNDLGALLVYGKEPAYKLLIALEKSGYTWEKNGQVLRVRPVDSLIRRAREIPQALVADFRQRYEKQGRYTLEDTVELVSSLTDTQLVEGLPYNTGLMGYDSQIIVKDSGSREVLRLYDSLSRLQEISVRSSSGVRLPELSSQQWQRVRRAVPDNVQDAALAGGTFRLTITNDGDCGFIIASRHEEGQEPHEVWSCYLSGCLPAAIPQRRNNDE